MKSGGSFGAGSGKAQVSEQPSRGTTTNNTDTSAARKLDSAPDAEARRDAEGGDESAELDTGRGQGKAAGIGPTSNVPSKGSSGGSSGSSGSGSRATGDESNAAAAPSAYSASQPSEGVMKPKGRNLTEGGFDADESPNASFNNEIGGENDPGRMAENKFQRVAAESGIAAGGGHTQQGTTSEGQFNALGEEQA